MGLMDEKDDQTEETRAFDLSSVMRDAILRNLIHEQWIDEQENIREVRPKEYRRLQTDSGNSFWDWFDPQRNALRTIFG